MPSCAILAVVVVTLSQSVGQLYEGTWIAEVAGKTFTRLELSFTDGRLGGRMSLANFQVDAQGQVTSAGALNAAKPIIDLVLGDSMLAFNYKDGDSKDRFEMRLRGRDAAELSLVFSSEDLRGLAQEGITAPQPLRVRRVDP